MEYQVWDFTMDNKKRKMCETFAYHHNEDGMTKKSALYAVHTLHT